MATDQESATVQETTRSNDQGKQFADSMAFLHCSYNYSRTRRSAKADCRIERQDRFAQDAVKTDRAKVSSFLLPILTVYWPLLFKISQWRDSDFERCIFSRSQVSSYAPICDTTRILCTHETLRKETRRTSSSWVTCWITSCIGKDETHWEQAEISNR